jgi:hypothetical protein
MAPIVDTVAYLPTLSLPLQGGDLTPNRLGRNGRLRNERSTPLAFNQKARVPPPVESNPASRTLSSREPSARRGR